MSEQDKFEAWGVLELFGHLKLAGLLTEQSIGGCHFVRIDVPDTKDTPGYTRLFSNGAIYSISFVSEDVARGVSETLRARPVQSYELPHLPARDEDPETRF